MIIEGYEFGEIVIDWKRYTHDVIIFPDRIDDKWWRREGHKLHIDDLKEVIDEKPDVLIIGTGYYGVMKVLPETEKYIKSKGMGLIIEKTKKAYEIYNQISRSKRVIAVLHLTC